MKRTIIFATGNQNKVREIREIIQDPETTVLTMQEAGVAAEPEENGETFTDNALIKARAVMKNVRAKRSADPSWLHGDEVPIIVMSDDSGLCIDALHGAPGVHSARFMGHETSYTVKMNALLEQLKDVPDEKRTARFTAAVAAIVPLGPGLHADQCELTTVGNMEGMIAHSIRGENGFGYDPFFYLPEYGKTSAEISEEEKNAISHRGKAIRAMLDLLAAMPPLRDDKSSN